MTKRSYSELSRIPTFEERFRYLEIGGRVGHETFGAERMLNQQFYRSQEWRHIRKVVVARDLGFDLGVDGYNIPDKMIIHHMNPITPEEILDGSPDIIDPEFLITTSFDTHNKIHYGHQLMAPRTFVERKTGDTVPW